MATLKAVTTTEGTPPFSFSAEGLAECKRIIARYPEGRSKSALLPILHIEVYEVASFYSMYNLRPIGRHLLEVCRTSPCMIRGSDDIIAYIEKKLNIHAGETTKDGLFTLKGVECLGSCGTAPMLQCGAKYHENLTPEKVDALLEQLRNEPRHNYTDR